jgi:hypothetical protein
MRAMSLGFSAQTYQFNRRQNIAQRSLDKKGTPAEGGGRLSTEQKNPFN